ncbi:hypothetical protein MUP79_07160 [Candidatus Bathyarchaeota archaeon]|nr:hypothetical protein [Candidatus Bathyarchaeota archaeon]
MTKYYDAYKAVFDRVKADLEAVSSIKAVVLGEQFRLTELPLAIVNPEPTEISQAAFGGILDNKIGISIVLVIRETEPSNWFTDIISVMGDAMDKILSDRTLNNTVRDVIPTVFGPGEIRTQNKLFYGGVLKFQALMFFTP